MANQYITTDDSLEKFKTEINEKNKKFHSVKDDYVKNLNNNLKNKIKTGKIFNTMLDESKPKEKIINKIKIPKNVAKALEYYNFLES
jgi:hypothetical protein